MTLLGNAAVSFPFKPQIKDASALFWACPSETIKIQRLSVQQNKRLRVFSNCASSANRGDSSPGTGAGVLLESLCYANVLQSKPASTTSMPHSIVTGRNSSAAAAHLHSVFPFITLMLRNFYLIMRGKENANGSFCFEIHVATVSA